jgi:guanylate kinase
MITLKPLVLSGPSGCGKSTIISKLMEQHPNKFGFSVSHTTRQSRPGEVDGTHYHFAQRQDMERDIQQGLFLESATFSNNLYGTSKQSVEDVLQKGQICILDIDSQGVKSIKKSTLDCVLVFVKPPSFEELERRLRGRGTECEEAIQRRLDTCKGELEYASQPDSYNYTIVNDDLDKAYTELKGIINKEMNASI